MTDQELHQKLTELVREERRVLAQILTHLKEVERRKLYCDFKRGSLFDYAVHELGYSEDQAQRRIEAMRLLKDLPEIQPAIEEGRLTLTNLGQAKRLFRHKPHTREEKLAFITKIEHKTKREAERLIATQAPELPRLERRRATTATTSQLSLELPNETLDILQQLKGALAHKHPQLTTAELITLLAREKLAALRPAPARKASAPPNPHQRYIPQQLRRELKQKAQHACENCGSHYALEIDHIQPFARGGPSTPRNLRVLCRACNQRRVLSDVC